LVDFEQGHSLLEVIALQQELESLPTAVLI
jgi:predicted nucleotidyltransferase